MEGSPEPGAVVDVFYADGKFAGKGYYNAASQIMVRLLTREPKDTIDEAWFQAEDRAMLEVPPGDRLHRKLPPRVRGGRRRAAVHHRQVQRPLRHPDPRPRHRPLEAAIVKALQEIFQPKGIFERNDVPVRELEGLPQHKGFLSAPFDTNIVINENGLKFHVDIENGQKTGYFLDQQDNRRAIEHIVKGQDVLGAFTYTGTFEIHAAHYGAKSVLGLDISQGAVDQANRNAALNGLEISSSSSRPMPSTC